MGQRFRDGGEGVEGLEETLGDRPSWIYTLYLCLIMVDWMAIKFQVGGGYTLYQTSLGCAMRLEFSSSPLREMYDPKKAPPSSQLSSPATERCLDAVYGFNKAQSERQARQTHFFKNSCFKSLRFHKDFVARPRCSRPSHTTEVALEGTCLKQNQNLFKNFNASYLSTCQHALPFVPRVRLQGRTLFSRILDK